MDIKTTLIDQIQTIKDLLARIERNESKISFEQDAEAVAKVKQLMLKMIVKLSQNKAVLDSDCEPVELMSIMEDIEAAKEVIRDINNEFIPALEQSE